jgi:hypothetical protein
MGTCCGIWILHDNIDGAGYEKEKLHKCPFLSGIRKHDHCCATHVQTRELWWSPPPPASLAQVGLPALGWPGIAPSFHPHL